MTASTQSRVLNLATLPDGCDFLVGSTNGGLTIHARVGDVEEYADTVQEAFDAAGAAFNERSRKLVNENMEGPSR